VKGDQARASLNSEATFSFDNGRDGTLVARVVGNSHELRVLADELLVLLTSRDALDARGT
jgi:hypothetical protein